MAKDNKKKSKKEKAEPHKKKEYKFDFDELKMYFREPHLVKMPNDEYIEIRQPSIGEIIEMGDREVYAAISPFITNTTACRVQLWDAGEDWNKISDFKLFSALVTHADNVDFLFKKVTFVNNPEYDDSLSEEKNRELGQEKIIKLYSKIDFTKLDIYAKQPIEDTCKTKEICLYDPMQNILIDEETYMHIREYVRMIFNRYPKEEFAKGKTTKLWIIGEEKEKIKREAEKNDRKSHSVLLPIVSGLLNHPGFKYDLEGMKNLGIFAFMDCAKRLQVYEKCTAFLKGIFSGMMDTSKFGEEELNRKINWLRDIYEDDDL